MGRPKKYNGENQEATSDTPLREILRVESEADAIDLVLQNYQVPDHVKVVFVSEDRNVFYHANAAQIHAKQNDLKLFSITWD